MDRRKGLLILALLACGFASGCGREQATKPPSSGPVGPNGVIFLTPTQRTALRFGKAETYRFVVDTEATGAVSFVQDPALAQAYASYATALAVHEQTTKEYARVHGLGAASGIAAKDIEQAAADMRTAEANLNAARAALRALGGSPERLAAMAQSKSATAAKTVLVYAIEDDVPAIHTDAPAQVRLDVYPGEVFAGTVREVYGAIDPGNHRAGVQITVIDPQNRLRPGMLAQARITTAPPFDAIAVPADAIVREGDGTMTAWVTKDGGHFIQRMVKTGVSQSGRVEILHGLRAGETVVTSGAAFLDNMLQSPPDD